MTSPVKLPAYQDLVIQRKLCTLCRQNLVNPRSIPAYDPDEIGPWSLWQNSLDAEILVVGPDRGNVEYLKKHLGRNEDRNSVNRNLAALFASIDIKVHGPESGRKNPRLFFTNAVLCLQPGRTDTPLRAKDARICCTTFLKPLIGIIEPKVVIALGKVAYSGIVASFGLDETPFDRAVDIPEGIPLSRSTRLFPVYHCTGFGYRSPKQQAADWKKIGEHLTTSQGNGISCRIM